jgi:hypothetical protein
MNLSLKYCVIVLLLLPFLFGNCTKTCSLPFVIKNYTPYTLTKVNIDDNIVSVQPMDTVGVPITIKVKKPWYRIGMNAAVLEFSDSAGTYKHNRGIYMRVKDMSETENIMRIRLLPDPVFPEVVFEYRLAS